MKKPKSTLPASLDIQEGQDVFISYSRADQEWGRWLSGQFVSAGRQPWVDWHGIKPGEKWWPAILQGIDAANAFVFVLSPDSGQSTVCKQEINRAVESGKRIVPLVCRDISGLDIHPALKERNYIFLRTEEERAENLPKLLEALDTDLEHVRAHSRFGVRAREWEAKGKSSAFLLRGGALEDAIQWQARAPGKLPVPTPLQTELIQTSRKAARRRQRLTTGAITGGLLVAVGLALVAIEQRNAATTERDRAEEQTREARIQAGKGHVLRGNIHPSSSDRVFYNARAVGFAGLGKPHPTGEDAGGRAKPSASAALREVRLDIRNAWTRITGGKELAPAAITKEDFPILLAGNQSAEEAARAYHDLGMAGAHPFLWKSPVASQHSKSVTSLAWSPDGQTLASGSGDNSIKLWDVASGNEKATLAGHSWPVLSVSWSSDGETLASGSMDNSIKLWETTVIVQTDLYRYVKEGWCRFDPKTENLEWNEPKRELYRSIETPFRNVPRWSSLGILQRKDLGTDEKHWLLYLKALQAENWAAAALFRGRLSPEQRKIPHGSVDWGIRTLADQSVSACKAGLPVIARIRVASALGFLSGLEPVQAERFYARLGEGFGKQGIESAQVELVLAALPDDAARAAVTAVGAASQPAPASK